ncbi:hypothetical protein GCM10009844_44940 [Nocardioides koreensis]|uniref:VIT family protein n=1 Tax=Nocardioides koreensis TaxID=433651 RepID=A0ABN3A944_9ACTN
MAANGPSLPSRPPRASLTRDTEESTAAGIYGVIVSAAVMAASHERSAAAVTAAVLVTLVIYWGAERYARLVAERIHDGRRPTWQEIRRQLTTGWEMVSASILPLVVMTAAYQLGTGLDSAILAALVCSTVLLCLAGWQMGRSGQLTGLERVASAAVAGAFGLVMIALKTLLH